MVVDKWNTITTNNRTLTKFKKRSIEEDKNCCCALKSSVGGSKLAGQYCANQVEDLNTMVAATMAGSANAAEDFVHAAIKDKSKQ